MTLKNKPLISIVIPARNEEAVILQTLQSVKKKVKTSHEILIVNDLSTDRTEKVVREYAKKNSNVLLINNKQGNGGFSNAIKLGFRKARGVVVIPVMADMCDDPSTIDKMYKKVELGNDLVCGSRYVRGGKKYGGPQFQGFFSLVFNAFLATFIRIPTRDASNAFKMYKKSITGDLVFDKKSGVEMSAQLVLQAYFNGAKIVDVPTVWKGRTQGKSKFKLLERSPRYAKIIMWALAKKYFGY